MQSDPQRNRTTREFPVEVAPSFPHRATSWKLGDRVLQCGRWPQLMGIVNVTPDSFSDGGQFYSSEQVYSSALAIDHGLALAAEGADILDIGGESTRPYSEPVPANEERNRVVPVVRELARQTKLPISIDTSKASVAAAAIDAGATIINDVTGLTGDAEMIPLAKSTGVGVCAMHMQGTPQTMQDDPKYDDVVGEIAAYLQQRLDQLVSAGVSEQAICLDPGIGFGKTHAHNLRLMQQVGEYHRIGQPLLVGHSRKGFLARIIADKEVERTSATVGASLSLALQGVQFIRIHGRGRAPPGAASIHQLPPILTSITLT